MDEKDLADRFSREVDDLLQERQTGFVQPPLPGEYRQALDLARALTAVDLSGESRVRQTLRHRLLNRLDGREGWSLRKEFPMPVFSLHRHPAVILTVVALLTVLVVTLAWPGALTTAAQGIENVVQTLVLGQHTAVGQVTGAGQAATLRPKPVLARPVVERRGDLWIIRTAIGSFGGNVPPGKEATVHRFTTLDEAQAALPFALRRPAYLPQGYALREVMVAPIGEAFLFYDGPQGDILLAQMAVGMQPGGAANEAIATAVQVLTDGAIESVALGGQTAAWVEDHSLMWEAEGISYTLGGAGLSLDEARRIATSLK